MAYLQAIALDPEKSESYYNIGLIYKYQGKWAESLEYNAKAYALDPEDEAVRWNLAIAATALRDWDVARRAWKDNGFVLDDELGSIKLNLGITPVRLNPDGSGEVVWATRIDPVRARIDSVPYKESGFRHADVVLHDGAAVGYRKAGECEYPVFNVLELFEASTYMTAVASIEISSDHDLTILEALLEKTAHDFEDWTTNIRTICRQCSEGKPHDRHDEDLAGEWRRQRTLGVAVHDRGSVLELFEEWQNSTKGNLLAFEE